MFSKRTYLVVHLRTAAIAAICVLAAFSTADADDYVQMWDNGPSANRVNIVFLGDGYLAEDQSTLYADHINTMLNFMFGPNDPPLARYADFFNVYRIPVVSNQRGADRPQRTPATYVDTALGAYYNDSSRLLLVNSTKATQALANGLGSSGIQADIRFVTVNDAEYGGAGGYWGIFSGANSSAARIAVHEMAHSFANLADEYSYSGTTYTGAEPYQANVTTDPNGAKWARWLGYTDPRSGYVVGAYEGGYYNEHGIYRPCPNCMMRSLDASFCPVCAEQLVLKIYDVVDPIDDWLDNSSPLTDPSSLWVDVIDPNVIDVDWLVNGEVLPWAHDESFDPMWLGPGDHTVTARATDNTFYVRLASDVLEQEVSWSVHMTVLPEPAALTTLVLAAAFLGRRRFRASAA